MAEEPVDHASGIVLLGTVVAARRPLLLQALRHLVDVVDLIDRHALVGIVQRLVVEVRVRVTLRAQHLLDAGVAPARPAVGGEHHLGLLAEFPQRRVDVLRPVERVAHRRTAQRVDVVDGARHVLRSPECLELREPGIHLDRRLGVGRVLEHHLHAVERDLLDVLGDEAVRRDQSHGATGDVLADRLIHMTERVALQQRGVLHLTATRHDVAGEHVLGNRMFHESFGRDQHDLAADHVGLIHDASHARPVVHVCMRIDDAHDRTLAELFVDQFERRPRRLLRGQRVEHDPAGVALDEADVREIEAAHLVDAARHHLVQPVTHVEHRLPLQRGMNAREILAGQQPLVALHVPGHVPRIGLDLLVRGCSDEATCRFVEVPLVVERQLGLQAVAQFERERRRWLALRVEVGRGVRRDRDRRGEGEAQGEARAQRTGLNHADSRLSGVGTERGAVAPERPETDRERLSCMQRISRHKTCIGRMDIVRPESWRSGRGL